jgi:hypothetical protein
LKGIKITIKRKATKGTDGKPFMAVIPSSVMFVQHDICGHTFATCESVAEYQIEHPLPCSVCDQKDDYRQHDIAKMKVSVDDGVSYEYALLCDSCHQEVHSVAVN